MLLKTSSLIVCACLCLCYPGVGGWAVWRCGSVWGHLCFCPGPRCTVGNRVRKPRVRKTHPSDYWSADINTRHKWHPIHSQFVLDKSRVGRLTSLCANSVNAYKTNFFIWKAQNYYDVHRLEVSFEDVTYTTITIIYKHCNTFKLCFVVDVVCLFVVCITLFFLVYIHFTVLCIMW